ncbi:MAG: AEC family transporter [Thermotaleaceae bacterium]
MQTLNQIFILFLLLLMGYVSKRLKIISNDMNRDLSNLVIKVALPALIISSLSSYDFEKEMLIKSGALIVISCAVYGLSIFIAAVVPKFYGVEGTTKDIFQFMTVFSNVGFMGYPIINAIYGEQGVFYTALYNLPFNAVLWTYGVMVLSRPMAAPKQVVLDNRGSVQIKQLINPGLVSVMIGLCLFMTSTKLPGPVFSAFQAMGNTSTPLSMIFIGSILADTKVRAIFTNSKIFVASTLRLVVIPVIVMVVLRLLGFEGMMVGIPVLISAMPVAANCAIMSTTYGNDYYLASQGIFISTLLSMATIPLIAMLL